MVRTILFDMDGVVISGSGTDRSVYEAATDAALADCGVEPTDEQRRSLSAWGYSDAVEDACTALGVDPETYWARREHHASRIANERFRDGDRAPYDDADVLHDLADRATLGLVSNNRHETVEFVVEHFGLEEAFAAVRGRDPTIRGYERRKPRPYYIAETLETLGATDAVYVGDRASDVEAARAAGVEPAFLRRPHNRDEQLPEGATIELASLTELADALGTTRS